MATLRQVMKLIGYSEEEIHQTTEYLRLLDEAARKAGYNSFSEVMDKALTRHYKSLYPKMYENRRDKYKSIKRDLLVKIDKTQINTVVTRYMNKEV